MFSPADFWTFSQGSQDLLRNHTFDFDEVTFPDFMIRMHQPMGQHSVIRQQQQSLRVIIEPSHREQSSGITGEKVLNGSPSLGII